MIIIDIKKSGAASVENKTDKFTPAEIHIGLTAPHTTEEVYQSLLGATREAVIMFVREHNPDCECGSLRRAKIVKKFLLELLEENRTDFIASGGGKTL